MKYIYYILIIMFGLSAIVGYELFGKVETKKEAALIINDRVITTDEFNNLYSSRPSYIKDKNEFLNSLITKELLIQESQKEGIDKEEPFRRSIQNFYEQSLTKLLIDRKFNSLRITLPDDELNRYIELSNKKLHITIFHFDDEGKAKKGIFRDGERKTLYFEDLSKDVRYGILTIKQGEITAPIRMGEKYIVIRLDKIEPSLTRIIPDIEKERIRKMLIEDRKEKIISDWIADLRKKASIKIFIKGENQGDYHEN
jgi:hypothetical protein